MPLLIVPDTTFIRMGSVLANRDGADTRFIRMGSALAIRGGH